MALGYIGQTRDGHHISQVYCDKCAQDRIFPMLHETLYKDATNDSVYLCEIHAILCGRRPMTPGFLTAYQKAQEKAEAERVARINSAYVPSGTVNEPVGLLGEGEQSRSPEDRHDNEAPSVE